ncbi:hypothetical protein HLH33_00600 [Gluconacetobacter diazotrophicus]|uniref:Uncharacterized protein n=1 Tax=Gluconacetobacter diazotrophicus TaxID=33996 RepID=A0A7W4I589_GLUDI|nr:hypothetical protein [Gluconacetobacter diazotrophicus]MBB2154820.1 hypothetical protein [Gluconacetobacter diazotrophicus]
MAASIPTDGRRVDRSCDIYLVDMGVFGIRRESDWLDREFSAGCRRIQAKVWVVDLGDRIGMNGDAALGQSWRLDWYAFGVDVACGVGIVQCVIGAGFARRGSMPPDKVFRPCPDHVPTCPDMKLRLSGHLFVCIINALRGVFRLFRQNWR